MTHFNFMNTYLKSTLSTCSPMPLISLAVILLSFTAIISELFLLLVLTSLLFPLLILFVRNFIQFNGLKHYKTWTTLKFYLHFRLLPCSGLCNYPLNTSNWLSNRHLKFKTFKKTILHKMFFYKFSPLQPTYLIICHVPLPLNLLSYLTHFLYLVTLAIFFSSNTQAKWHLETFAIAILSAWNTIYLSMSI